MEVFDFLILCWSCLYLYHRTSPDMRKSIETSFHRLIYSSSSSFWTKALTICSPSWASSPSQGFNPKAVMNEVHPPYDLITCFSARLRPAGSITSKMWLAFVLPWMHLLSRCFDRDLGPYGEHHWRAFWSWFGFAWGFGFWGLWRLFLSWFRMRSVSYGRLRVKDVKFGSCKSHVIRKCQNNGLVRVESTYQAYMVEVSDSCKMKLSRILYKAAT